MEADPWTGKDLLYDGVWCIKDMGTPKYDALQKLSQKTVTYMDQFKYGHYLLYFITVIISLFIIKRLIYFFTDRNSLIVNKSSNYSKNWYYRVAAFNRWVSYRRLPSYICEICQLPSSLGNLIIILAGLIYMLCYTFIPHFYYRGCRGFGSPPLAVRAGIESIALIPISIILSGKTNLISQLTGISYERLNVYHRWISTMSCFFAWVHTIPFYIQAVREGGIARLSWFMGHDDNLYRNGIAPLVFLTVLTIFSHSYVRNAWYELWLQIHWICALGLYVSLFIHVNELMDGTKYMIATIVFWFTQLVWRAVNKSFMRPNKGFLRANTCRMKKFYSNDDNHYFELIIENSNDFNWVPGQHLFIRVTGLRCIENHPFSIVSYNTPRESDDIKLIIKASKFGGITKDIYDKLNDNDYTTSKIIVDGPYGGCERPIDAFDSAFLFCTGTGVSAVLTFLHDACVKIESADNVLNNVTFDWVIRNFENIEWILPELKLIINKYNRLIENGNVKINIYFKEETSLNDKNVLENIKHQLFTVSSADEGEATSESETDEKHEKEYDQSLKLVNLVNEKPDVKQLVKDKIDDLQQRNIFIVSGTDSMKVSVSNEIASLQKQVFANNNVDEIYLHSETFGW